MVYQKNPERLEKMLKIIKEMKERDYIGTKEAFNIIKEIECINSNPGEISREINEGIRDLLLTYPATPEKVYGLERAIHFSAVDIAHIDPEDEDFFEKVDKSPDFYLWLSAEKLKTPLSEVFEIFNGDDIFSEKSRGNARNFIPFFRKANEYRTSSDQGLKKVVLEVFNAAYENIRPHINSDETEPSCDYFMSAFQDSLESINWDEQLSRTTFLKDQTKAVLETSSNISTQNMFARLTRDRVLNRQEYRRMLLCKVILASEKENFEELIDKYGNLLQKGIERLKVLKGLDPPYLVLRKERNLIRYRTFISNLIRQEENFIRRFLRG